VKNRKIYKVLTEILIREDISRLSGNQFLKLFIIHCRERWGLLAGEVLRTWKITNYGELEQYLKELTLIYKIELTDPSPDPQLRFEDIFSI
jgi:hypothetical protein